MSILMSKHCIYEAQGSEQIVELYYNAQTLTYIVKIHLFLKEESINMLLIIAWIIVDQYKTTWSSKDSLYL